MVQYNLLTPTYKILWSHSFLRQSLERNTTGYLVLGRLHDEFTVHVNDLARKNKLSIKYNAPLPDCPQKVKSIHVPAGFNPTGNFLVRRQSAFNRKNFYTDKETFLATFFLLPHLVIQPVLLLQRAEVLQAQCVLVVRHHEARNRSGGQPDPVPSHLLFDIHSTTLEEITQELNINRNYSVFMRGATIFRE